MTAPQKRIYEDRANPFAGAILAALPLFIPKHSAPAFSLALLAIWIGFYYDRRFRTSLPPHIKEILFFVLAFFLALLCLQTFSFSAFWLIAVWQFRFWEKSSECSARCAFQASLVFWLLGIYGNALGLLKAQSNLLLLFSLAGIAFMGYPLFQKKQRLNTR